MTYSIDFDACIHDYHGGWKDGSIYGWLVPGAAEAIQTLLAQQHSVFILTTRSPSQIKLWFDLLNDAPAPNLIHWAYDTIPWWRIILSKFFEKYRFWNEPWVGITNTKLIAHIYIDDRGLKFNGDWDQTMKEIKEFKTYQE